MILTIIRKFFLTNIRNSASQFGQDLWVAKNVFKGERNKLFIELGAFEGIALSNTLLLEKRFNWSGILIEANPKCFEKLVVNRKSSNAICVNSCVSSHREIANFVLNGELGGISEHNPSKLSQDVKEVIEIQTASLQKILSDNNASSVIDYLSLDVEGFEDEVLLDFPFESYRFLCMTIERPSDLLKQKLKSEGYLLVKELPRLDSYFIHGSIADVYRENAMSENWNWYLFKINALIKFLGC